MKIYTAAVLCLLGIGQMTQALRVAILNDLHLNRTYDQSCTFMRCYDRGDYGSDSPAKLVETILEDMQRETDHGKKYDAIMIGGDFVVHGLSSDDKDKNNWPQMKEVIADSMKLIQRYFPDTPILPNIGNNDLLHHYQAPSQTERAMFYGDLYSLWFDEVKANQEAVGA
jgi:hypothetical protein